ncbi:hypothetical protein GOP47_0015429 [Adiantum capillus-veneris]|uniref:Uncharacterized protein n=1 Tax=Adiantum capillus-veneris TaxID=13818 RepID=A0A9D4ZB86_ADICA|nr:hypothetical protein GOP47_0015429 [Adiantum capillus-veneris]
MMPRSSCLSPIFTILDVVSSSYYGKFFKEHADKQSSEERIVIDPCVSLPRKRAQLQSRKSCQFPFLVPSLRPPTITSTAQEEQLGESPGDACIYFNVVGASTNPNFAQKVNMVRRILEGGFRHSTAQGFSYSVRSQISAFWYQVLIAAVVLILAPLLIFASRHSPVFSSRKLVWVETSIFSGLAGNLEYIQATQVVWQIPSSPKAILFIAHGCHCRATFFWDRSTTCSECIGLPEERSIVARALGKGYAVIAISSTRECWGLQADKTKVLTTLSSWIRDKGLERLPVVALGASSGGFFVSALAMEYKFSALVIMISEGKFKSLQVKENYPSTLFMHMPKDKRRAALIKDAMDMLRGKGIETAEVKCYQLPVTPQLFTKIPGMDTKTSERIYRALRGTSMLDSASFMTKDGRFLNWMTLLKRQQVMPEKSLRKWELHLQELLNLAFGYHEMTSLQADDMFKWFDSHLPKDTF